MKLAKAAPGLDAQLLDQHGARSPEGLEGLGLATGAIEAQHQLAVELLAQRMLPHEPFQFADHVRMTTRGELGVDPLLDRGQSQLLQPHDLGLGERLIREIRKRRPPPQSKRLAQHLPRALRIRAASLRDKAFEPSEVELGRIEPQHIARRARQQPIGAELLA